MIRTEKRIGIVTIQGRFNYGNRLQNYATEELYKMQGYHPESLIYNRTLPPLQFAKQLMKKALNKLPPQRESMMSEERLSAFDRFNDLMTFRTVKDLDLATFDRYCYISVGSDQIWRMWNGFGEDWQFLQFIDPKKRIALAPSFGVDNLTDSQLHRLGGYISDYPYLSVREESGAKLIRDASGRDAEVICDPTLALSATDWRLIADKRLTPNDDYVFAYLLGDKTTEAQEALDIASGHGSLPIIYLSDRERPGEPPVGPAEFVSLIDSAAWVVTDSFHGSVFSSIFETPLTIVHRDGGRQMFGRIETLSEKIGIMDKVFGSKEFNSSRAGNYDGVSEAIGRERNRFVEFLGRCLDA